MTRILIANEFNEDRAGVADAKRKRTAWWTQRLLWFARDGDIVVQAVPPDQEFVAYVTALTGVRRSELHIVVPPPGALGASVLTPDRLVSDELTASLRAELDGRAVTQVVALHPDPSVEVLARALGAVSTLPGHAFLRQGGGVLANSKAVFRAVAAGVGVPIPDGAVCASRGEAEALITRMLGDGLSLMLKHDLRAGGRGNEIVTPFDGLLPVGAQRAVTLRGRTDVRTYLEQRWDWLTSHGRSPAVVEQYVPDSRALFAEFEIGGDRAEFVGEGELVSAPLAAAQIIPAPRLTAGARRALIDGGARLSAALHVMGYRGMLSADAILTPDDEILFTEYNGRITGSTPVYRVIGEHLVGSDFATRRTLLDQEGLRVPSFRAAVDVLADAGLAFDPGTSRGVVLVMPYNTTDGTVRYCIVEEDLVAAQECRQVVEELFARVDARP